MIPNKGNSKINRLFIAIVLKTGAETDASICLNYQTSNVSSKYFCLYLFLFHCFQATMTRNNLCIIWISLMLPFVACLSHFKWKKLTKLQRYINICSTMSNSLELGLATGDCIHRVWNRCSRPLIHKLEQIEITYC